jgi:hypothetical protein
MRLRLAGLLVLTLQAASCAEPPTKEHDQAEGAISAARAAEAHIYAPEAMQAAEAALRQYDDAVALGDYRQALGHAITARDQAHEAAKQASNEKAAARSRAEKLIVELEGLIKTAGARLAGSAGPRPSAQAAERLRAALRGAPQALQEARSLAANQSFRAAVDRLAPIVEAFRKNLAPPEATAGRRGRQRGA